jgi:hypothetical protein
MTRVGMGDEEWGMRNGGRGIGGAGKNDRPHFLCVCLFGVHRILILRRDWDT